MPDHLKPCRNCRQIQPVSEMRLARLVAWYGPANPKARGYYCAKCVWRMERHHDLFSQALDAKRKDG